MTVGLEERLHGLMVATLAGDGVAERRLLTELAVFLRRYFASRLRSQAADVEDLVQEVLIAVHTRRATYDPGQPLLAWLAAIARYKLIDHFRRTRPGSFVEIAEDTASVPDDSGAADARHDVETLLAGLNERQRTLLRQAKIEDLSVAEMAARNGLSESAVKIGVHRGLKALIRRWRTGGAR